MVVVTALAFDFTNGFHDTGNAMASSIATGALSPKAAVTLAATLDLVGALIGFLIFNFHPAKIFMGDTGSMTIGFILAILSLRFVELTKSVQLMELFNSRSAPVMVLAILIIPIVDTLRVFTIRIVKRRSPFSPDRNHIHHKLLQLGLSSRQVTVCLYLVNILFISAAFSVST